MQKVSLFDIVSRNKYFYDDPEEGLRTFWRINEHYASHYGNRDTNFYNNIELAFFKKENINIDSLKEVINIAEKLSNFLDQKTISKKINETNIQGTSSSKIQNIFINFCKELGFESEKKGLFKNYALRPDYYKKLDMGGILLEVERGKTITNNMDLYDLWKCHICEEANHLFLAVPQHVSHTSNIYKSSCRRLKSFFQKNNLVNIDSLFLFGY